MARTSKYTEEVLGKIDYALSMGGTYEMAAGYAGVGESTIYEWLEKKPDFVQRVKKARAMGQLGWLAKIEKAASDGNWQAAAWKLERLLPDTYGRQIVRQEHVGVVQVNHGLSLNADNPEAAAAARNLIAALSSASAGSSLAAGQPVPDGSLPDASRSGASGE